MTMLNATEPLPRPNRLNAAGWGLCCGEWRCQSPKCIQMYERTYWGLCDQCNGTQNLMTKGWCLCEGGLIEYLTEEDARESFERLNTAVRPAEQRYAVA